MCPLYICGWCNVGEGHKRHLAQHRNRELCLAGSLCELLVRTSLLVALRFPSLARRTLLAFQGEIFLSRCSRTLWLICKDSDCHYRSLSAVPQIFAPIYMRLQTCLSFLQHISSPFLLPEENDMRIIVLNIWINNRSRRAAVR